MTEAQLLAEVTDLCGRLGLLWHHCGRPDKSCQGNRGLPDLIIAGRRGVTFRELKSDDGDTSADQDLWIWTLHETPARYVWRPADWHSGQIRRELEELK